MATPSLVTVHLAKPVGSIDDAHKVLVNVLNHLGCPACLSGFDIRFTQAVDLTVNPANLAVTQIGR
jgi:hypothetical protein